jgi:hypothetical protein
MARQNPGMHVHILASALAARRNAWKNDSPRIPEASAADPAAPNCRNDLREAALIAHRESLSIISSLQLEIEN